MNTSKRTVGLIASAFLTVIASMPALALSGGLQGLHESESANWNAASPWTRKNLRGWEELDSIPCRVKLKGPATDSPVTIVFPHTSKGRAGFENLMFISNSPNVTITQAPVLNAPANGGDWSYSLNVTITNDEAAYIYFHARLAAGAYKNPGSSLHLSGEPGLGVLQIKKPGIALHKPNLAVSTSGPSTVVAGDTITYTLNYTNSATATNDTATEVELTATLPALLNYVPNSASGNGVLEGNVLTWNFPNLANQASGSVSYQVKVPTDAPVGHSLTSSTAILCAENDLDPADNNASVQTLVLAPQPPNEDEPIRITRIVKTEDGTFEIYFTTTLGRYYSLQSTEDFVNWTTDSAVIAGTGLVEVSRQTDTGANRFFRVLRLP